MIALLGLILRPVPRASPANTALLVGEVNAITAGTGEADILIWLTHDKNTYYINRGMDSGLHPDTLQHLLRGKTVSIQYIRHWTPLDPFNRSRHVARLSLGDLVLYDEMGE